jgi:hypothetical protein
MCERLLSNPLIEDYEIQSGHTAMWGEATGPGAREGSAG